MGLGDDSQNLHGINTTASGKTLPEAAKARPNPKINAPLHARQRFYRFSSRFVEIAGARARHASGQACGFCPSKCGDTSSVVLSVTMFVFFTRTAGTRCIACDFAPGRRVLGVEFAAALAGLQR